MKINMFKYLATIGITLGSIATSQAIPVTGTINFSGSATLVSLTTPPTVNNATGVSAWQNVVVGAGGGDGSFDAILPGTPASMFAPWTFNYAGPRIANFWQVGDFSFALDSSFIFLHASGFLNVRGTGVITGNGFDATAGNWSFTTQDEPTKKGLPPVFTFTWSGATTALPDGGTTVMLLGTALSGLAMLRRKLAA